MDHGRMPFFPDLLEAIGIFLRDVEVGPGLKQKKDAAWDALDMIARTLYFYDREARIYPCGKVSRIPTNPVAKVAE